MATKIYTVKKGDSLWSIAATQMGDGSRYPEIKSLNGLTSNIIKAGDQLKIPVQPTKKGYEDIGRQFAAALTDIRKLKSVQDLISMMGD